MRCDAGIAQPDLAEFAVPVRVHVPAYGDGGDDGCHDREE